MECKGCNKGVQMCHNKTCLGTPEEMEKIILEGHIDKLRITTIHKTPDYEELFPLKEQLKSEIGNSPMSKMLMGLMDVLQDRITDLYKDMPKYDHDIEFIEPGSIYDIGPIMDPERGPTGTCKFLRNDLCSIHHIKPEQGRESCCKHENDTSKNNHHYFRLWDTDKGRGVVRLFKLKYLFHQLKIDTGINIPTENTDPI